MSADADGPAPAGWGLLAVSAMGTRFELVLPDAQRAAGEQALAEIEHWHRRLNRFAADSNVAQINREAARGPVSLDDAMYALLVQALEINRASGGAFDITLGSGPDLVELDPDARTVRLARAGVTLDLGGIAKGHALDCAADVLRTQGVRHALLQAGATGALGIGTPRGAPAWLVPLSDDPDAPTVELRDRALGVSAAALRPHVLDPRGGELGAGLVGVIGPDAAGADAWATALLVLGERPATLGPEWQVLFR